MNYIIREIKEKDYIAVAKLYKKLRLIGEKYQTPFYTNQRTGKTIKSNEKIANDIIKKKALKANSKFLILEVEGEIIGFIYGILDFADTELYEGLDYIVGELDNLFVDEQYRGKGFSTKLRDNLFKWFKEKKVGLIEIGVNQENPVYNIYQKWGFKSKYCYVSKEI